MNSTESKKVRINGYICICVLFIINLLNYMDRYTIAAVLTQVQKTYEINDAEGGLLQTVFICFFLIFAPLSGYIGDRYNRKWTMGLGITIWSLAVLLSSFVPKNLFWVFVLLRGIIGIGEASYIVIAPTIIADTFVSVIRSRMLMLFYFAIPIGSGIGYMVGSWISSLFNDWRWVLRITPAFGLICLLLIICFVKDPKRGEAEKEVGATNALNTKTGSFYEDTIGICKIPTFIFSTLGYTSVVFVVGTLSWWGPTFVEHAVAANEGLSDTNLLATSKKDSISLTFGAITLVAGIAGVLIGGTVAELWHTGKWCCRPFKTARSNAFVCAIGCLFAVPFLILGMRLARPLLPVAWVLMFFAITSLCLNWSINADMLLDVVTPRRRGTATAWQTSFSHLFGDASGPYIIGLVGDISDWLRGSETSPLSRYNALINGFYLLTALLVFGCIFFFIAGYYYVPDHKKFIDEMGKLFTCSKKVYMVI
uniref:MFS domain-containing protein n=1 Tax=Syphacia muris TaxID=451379 RepID=A0A0N5AEF6_9BILA